MKYINSILGTSAVKLSADDVVPKRGLIQRDLVSFVTSLYNFNVSPQIPPGTPASANPVLNFQSGVLETQGEKIPITQLVIFQDGDAVFATDTELADTVLDDFMTRSDEGLSYRFDGAAMERLHMSRLVVEFESAFVERAEVFDIIQRKLNEAFNSSDHPYALRRISFGPDQLEIPPSQLSPVSVAHTVEREFTIERRATEPYSRNRFFCTAPITTSEHVRLLGDIERAVIG